MIINKVSRYRSETKIIKNIDIIIYYVNTNFKNTEKDIRVMKLKINLCLCLM